MTSRPWWALALLAQAVILGAGGLCATLSLKVGAGVRLGLSPALVLSGYAVAGGVALVITLAALVVARRVRAWPFEPLERPAWSEAPWAPWVLLPLAGFGTGLYASLLNDVRFFNGMHAATVVAYLCFLPIAFAAAMAVDPRRLRRFGSLTALMLGMEVGSQLGVAALRPALFPWLEVTVVDSMAWGAGALTVFLLEGLQSALRMRRSRSATPGE